MSPAKNHVVRAVHLTQLLLAFCVCNSASSQLDCEQLHERHLRVSCVLLDGPREKRDRWSSSFFRQPPLNPDWISLFPPKWPELVFAPTFRVLQYSLNTKSPGLEQFLCTHGTSCLVVCQKGLVNKIPILAPEYLILSQWIPVFAPTYSLPLRFKYLFTL